MTSKIFFKIGVVVILCLLAELPTYAKDRKVALVLGNADYTYLRKLNNAKNDARDVAMALESIGFEVLYYTDLDRNKTKAAIKEFGQKLDDSDVVLFYYAGHGVEILGKNYLVPVDADAETISGIKKTCIPANAIINFMKVSNSKDQSNILIIDACRSNPFSLREAANLKDGLALMDAPKGTIISFSTSPGRVASDGEGENGLFTEALLKYIMIPDMEIKSIFEKVRGHVIEKSGNQQVPWESTSLVKDLILRRKPEIKMEAFVLEGEEVTFEGEGVLHAQANLKETSFNWFLNGKQFSNQANIKVNKTGTYQVKVISREGQIILVKPIKVTIKSFVNLKAYILEGEEVKFNNKGILHGKANVTGKFIWSKEQNMVGEGADLEVTYPGLYNLTVVTVDGRKVTTHSINVKIKNDD